MQTRIRSAFAVLSVLAALAAMSDAGAQAYPKRGESLDALVLAGQFKSGSFAGRNRSVLPYRYFEPAAGNSGDARYPVILYLHGETEAGTDNVAQLTATDMATVWIEPHHLAENPAYVLAPQIPLGTDWTGEPAYSNTLALLSEFIDARPSADRNRVYIVGFSMGATGLWNMLLKNPQRFAAAMPISGSADAWLEDYDAWAALKNTPVIIVHDYDDTVVPVSAAFNAAGALQAAGNNFANAGGPTPSIWTPGSTASPHDAWQTAFERFEVIYYSLFWGDLGKTRNGAVDPTTIYTHSRLDDDLTQVWDYALGTAMVLERGDRAIIVDTTMGRIGENGGIYQYIRDNVLKNRDARLDIFITHQHNDHILGLPSFVGAGQVEKVYVHEADSAPVKRLLGADAGKVRLVKDGDRIPFDGRNVEIIGVPGHTLGSIIMKYEDYLFSGDTIGTGFVGVSRISIEDYVDSLTHLLGRMGDGHYRVYGAHTAELTAPVNERYVHDLLAVARGIVDGSITGTPYWRSNELATRKVATVGRSSITYGFTNIRKIDGALYGLEISNGTLNRGVRWRDSDFLASVAYYRTSVDASVESVDITPTVLKSDYRNLTINGARTRSAEPWRATLEPGSNRFAITVTAASGATKTYTLDVVRAAR